MTDAQDAGQGRTVGCRSLLPRAWVGVVLASVAAVSSAVALTQEVDSSLFLATMLVAGILDIVLLIYWSFSNLRLIEALKMTPAGECLPKPWTGAVAAVFANHLTVFYALSLATPVLWAIFSLGQAFHMGRHPALQIAMLCLAIALPLLFVTTAGFLVIWWYLRLGRRLAAACAGLSGKSRVSGTVYGAAIGVAFVASSLWAGFNVDIEGPETVAAAFTAVAYLTASAAYLVAFLSIGEFVGAVAEAVRS